MSDQQNVIEDELDDRAPPIEVKDLVSRYGDHVIHDGLNLRVRRGEVLGVVGGSGAGKSVLLNTLIGLKVPDGGVVKIFGQDLDLASNAKWDAIERSWGVLFQHGALFSNLTVKENVSAPMQEHTTLPKRLISRSGRAEDRPGRPAAGSRGAEAVGTVGRHDQARWPGAGAGAGPAASVPGRAHLRPGPDLRPAPSMN